MGEPFRRMGGKFGYKAAVDMEQILQGKEFLARVIAVDDLEQLSIFNCKILYSTCPVQPRLKWARISKAT